MCACMGRKNPQTTLNPAIKPTTPTTTTACAHLIDAPRHLERQLPITPRLLPIVQRQHPQPPVREERRHLVDPQLVVVRALVAQCEINAQRIGHQPVVGGQQDVCFDW